MNRSMIRNRSNPSITHERLEHGVIRPTRDATLPIAIDRVHNQRCERAPIPMFRVRAAASIGVAQTPCLVRIKMPEIVLTGDHAQAEMNVRRVGLMAGLSRCAPASAFANST
jgi:hypothetical protein